MKKLKNEIKPVITEVKTKTKPGMHENIRNKQLEKLKTPDQLKLEPLQLSDFNPVKPTNFLNISWIKQFWIRTAKRQEAVLINLEFLNGDHGSRFVSASLEGFKIGKDNLYLFDESMKYYNFTLKIFCYDFHEGFCLPIKRKFDVKALNDAIKTQDYEVELSTNPSVLATFEETKMAKWMMKAQEVMEELAKFKIWMIITMIICILTFVIVLKGSGMLSNIHIPFLSK